MEAAASFNDVDNLKATELRLGLPGTDDDQQQQEEKTTTAAATAALLLPTPPPSTPTRGKKRDGEAAPPAAKAQVVGWPPVRSYRKSCFQQQQQPSNKQQSSKQPAAAPAANKEDAAAAGGGGNTNSSSNAAAAAAALFVKVSMDGAPYLRKVDLKMYKGYRELREALEAMFLCFSSGGADAAVNPSDFAVTYEDKDGDLMLVGDVPFDMFTSTCKRLRIMKGSEARGLGSPKSATTN